MNSSENLLELEAELTRYKHKRNFMVGLAAGAIIVGAAVEFLTNLPSGLALGAGVLSAILPETEAMDSQNAIKMVNRQIQLTEYRAAT